MTKNLKEFKTFFAEKLKDNDYAVAYLNEALADDDKKVFLIALKNVIDANSDTTTNLARETNISRPTVYRMLSKKGNPRWDNITSVMDAMNLQISVSKK